MLLSGVFFAFKVTRLMAVRVVGGFLFQPAAQGALPQLFGATMSDVMPGGYYGPVDAAR